MEQKELIKKSYIKTSENYNQGACLDSYNGTISICSANQGKNNGEIYLQWCHPQRDRKPIEKSVPWKVTLGSIHDAIKNLKSFVVILENKDGYDSIPTPEQSPVAAPEVDDLDIPF